MRGELRESSCCPAGVKNRAEMAGGKQMRAWRLGALGLLMMLVSGCGGNSTPVGVRITGPGPSPLTVLVNRTAQFASNVSGASSSTVFWRICETARNAFDHDPAD